MKRIDEHEIKQTILESLSDPMRQIIDTRRNSPPDDSADDYHRGYSYGLCNGLEIAYNILDE